MDSLSERLRRISGAGSILRGLSTFTFDQPSGELRSMLDQEGLSGDWRRVGDGLRRAIHSVQRTTRRGGSSGE
jgi:hypothetical protein